MAHEGMPKPGTKFPDGPANPAAKQAGESAEDMAQRPPLRVHGDGGTQKSLNPRKNQPKVMRYV